MAAAALAIQGAAAGSYRGISCIPTAGVACRPAADQSVKRIASCRQGSCNCQIASADGWAVAGAAVAGRPRRKAVLLKGCWPGGLQALWQLAVGLHAPQQAQGLVNYVALFWFLDRCTCACTDTSVKSSNRPAAVCSATSCISLHSQVDWHAGASSEGPRLTPAVLERVSVCARAGC